MHLVSDTLKSLESHDHTKQRFISQYLSSPGQSATYSLIKSCGAAFLKKLLSLSGSGLWVSEIKKKGGVKKKRKDRTRGDRDEEEWEQIKQLWSELISYASCRW